MKHLGTASAWIAGFLAPVAALAIAAPQPNFGMPYNVVREPGSMPIVRNGELRVAVSYRGGCGSHAFTPVYRQQTMGSIVWLMHVTVDRCTALQREWVAIPLPPQAWQGHRIWLFTPEGEHLPISVP